MVILIKQYFNAFALIILLLFISTILNNLLVIINRRGMYIVLSFCVFSFITSIKKHSSPSINSILLISSYLSLSTIFDLDCNCDCDEFNL